MSEDTTLGPEFLAKLARGGFAETLSESQRVAIHIESQMDEFLASALDDGKQVVLTGNPGDGKTQYILIQEHSAESPEDAYYLPDASAESDYQVVLDAWQSALNDDRPGILAINEGPLYEMLTAYQDEYAFLDTVANQLDNQIILHNGATEECQTNDIIVLNLNYRNVLARPIALQAIKKLTSEEVLDTVPEEGHIAYNIEKLRNETVSENFKRVFRSLGKLDIHVTIRDLLNFIAYSITGGRSETVTDFDEELKYYNLAFTGRGRLFDLLREHSNPEDLTHPFVDSTLWARAERDVNPRDVEDARSEIRHRYVELKRRFIFEDAAMGVDYPSKDLYHDVDYDFLTLRNGDAGTTEDLETLIRRINGYFSDDQGMTYELKLWFSHRFIARSTKSILTRHSVSKSDFTIRRPELNPDIQGAMEYIPDHCVLEYTEGPDPVRLEIDRNLFDSFRNIDSGIPYVLRDREEEQVILEFMRNIEYEETPGETRGTVTIKDTETGKTETVRVRNDRYEIE